MWDPNREKRRLYSTLDLLSSSSTNMRYLGVVHKIMVGLGVDRVCVCSLMARVLWLSLDTPWWEVVKVGTTLGLEKSGQMPGLEPALALARYF